MDKLHRFRNLMVLAAADGRMTEEEVVFLSLRASRWGITDDQFQEALEFAKSPTADLEVPAKRQERHEMLADMLRMMAVDGELSDVERRLFAVVAATMGFERDELNALIDHVVSERD
jgi:uncharacterized tellurite resistance protein B-like protein